MASARDLFWSPNTSNTDLPGSIDVTHAQLKRYATCMDREEVMRVLRAFESTTLEYVLIGAAAMGFHGLVRVTEDRHLLIHATPENVESILNRATSGCRAVGQ